MKKIYRKIVFKNLERSKDIKYLERLPEIITGYSQLGASWSVFISIGVFLTTLGYLRRKNQLKKQLENTIYKNDIERNKKIITIKHYCPVKILYLEINRVDHHPLGR